VICEAAGGVPANNIAADREATHPTGEEAPLAQDLSTSGTICRACADRLTTYRRPVLVVSREWARLYEDIAALLKSRPDIQVIIDRRHAPRDGSTAGTWTGPNRRASDEPLGLK
jgi:hypothetical protein